MFFASFNKIRVLGVVWLILFTCTHCIICERSRNRCFCYLQLNYSDSTLWREMAHVKRKVDDPRLNFKNTLYTGSETKIATITATYAAPKIGAPMISHPENPCLQRQFTVNEHCKINKTHRDMGFIVSKHNDELQGGLVRNGPVCPRSMTRIIVFFTKLFCNIQVT